MAESHQPVLADRVADLLGPALQQPGATLVDATVGAGGHAAVALSRYPGLRLIGIDRDPQAVALARRRLAGFGDRVRVIHATYDRLPELLSGLVEGVLFDLGVSSMQLDDDARGFAYSRDTRLDMRMDPTRGRTAADILAGYDREALARVFREYGDERYADRIADRIVAARRQAPITRSAELVALIRDAIPAPARRRGGHPANRVFQALRIEVNDELALLRRGLDAALDHLATGGRIVVLAYHSLEDRIVKQTLAARAKGRVPLDVPIRAGADQPELQLLTRGAEKADAAEVAANPRAASVRLRAAVRLGSRS